MPKQGYVDVPFGQPPFPDPGTTRIGTDNAGNPIASIGGAAYAGLGGGGGLTPIAAKSTLANTTGGTALPVATSVAGMQAMLGVPANWFAATLAFIESLTPLLNTVTWQAEFTPNPGGAEIALGAAGGSGAGSLLATVPGGVMNLQTGATAASSQLARNVNGNGAPANILTPNMQTSKWAYATRAKIIAVNNTADIYICGITDEAVLTTYFGVHGATSTTNLVLVTTAGHDLGVAFTVGSYLDYLMYADGTNINCYTGDGTGSNWTSLGSPQAQSVLPVNPGHTIFDVLNNATASNVQSQWDKALFVSTTPA